MASVVAEVGSLFPRLRALMCKSCRQKVHRTVARARFALEHVKALSHLEHFWNMRLAQCARDCSESLISHNRKKTVVFGALLEDEVGKMRTRL